MRQKEGFALPVSLATKNNGQKAVTTHLPVGFLLLLKTSCKVLAHRPTMAAHPMQEHIQSMFALCPSVSAPRPTPTRTGVKGQTSRTRHRQTINPNRPISQTCHICVICRSLGYLGLSYLIEGSCAGPLSVSCRESKVPRVFQEHVMQWRRLAWA